MDKKLNSINSRENSLGTTAHELIMSDDETTKYARVVIAALGGIPWVGSVLGVISVLSSENEQGDVNQILYLWAKEHEHKLKEFNLSVKEMQARFEKSQRDLSERINSDEYLGLVRKTFSQWDTTETHEKKEMLNKLIINAGLIELVKDDLIRLFLDWINKYHEFHFSVIREIYKNPGITRRQIWVNLRENLPTDSSSEAHLFKLLINDLSLGEVIHQHKEVDINGNYMKLKPAKKGTSRNLQSAFEETKRYELTALGKEFVHYVMNDAVIGIENS
ncbi:MAG: hypothetical protein ACI870_000269 [Crocinitomicaceae bacterium]|jgi:hypothetical protein